MFYPVGHAHRKDRLITLPPDLLVKAQSYAEREHRTMSELFREALRRYMSADPEWEPSSPALARAKAMRIHSEEDVERLRDEYSQAKHRSKTPI